MKKIVVTREGSPFYGAVGEIVYKENNLVAVKFDSPIELQHVVVGKIIDITHTTAMFIEDEIKERTTE